jgi:hypothetical protein
VETKKYSYGSLHKFSNVGFWILATFCFLIGLFFVYGFFQLLFFPGSDSSMTLWEVFREFLLYSVWSPVFFAFFAGLYPDVTIKSDGLLINFAFRDFSVDWNNVVEIKPARFLGIPMLGKAKIVFVSEGLTRFHVLYGILYGASFRRAFLVTSYISDYHSVMKAIAANSKSDQYGKISKPKKNKSVFKA